MPSAAVCGTVPDPADVEPVPSDVPLTLADFGVVYKATFAPCDIAEAFGVSERTIYREIEDGNLRAVPIRGSLRIPLVELKHYILRQQAAAFYEAGRKNP